MGQFHQLGHSIWLGVEEHSVPIKFQHVTTAATTRPPARSTVDRRMAAAVKELLVCMGEDPTREGLLKTPERVAKAMLFMTHGCEDPSPLHARCEIARTHAQSETVSRSRRVASRRSFVALICSLPFGLKPRP